MASVNNVVKKKKIIQLLIAVKTVIKIFLIGIIDI